MNRTSWLILAIAVMAGIGLTYWSRSGGNNPQSIILPKLSAEALAGRTIFEARCKACHGKNATGTRNGPPLVHKIYETNHHSDLTFYRAAERGVRQHHWPFGNMPPVPDVGRDDVTRIIRYIRELQRANGIF